MKRILFIMLEIESASGICTRNVAERLVEHGYAVDILSYSTEIQFDLGCLYQIHPKFNIRMRKKFYSSKVISCIFSYLFKLQVGLTKFMWPWNSPLFTWKLYRKILSLDKINSYDCIIAVYSQLDPILATAWLKRRYANKKIISYFLDSLSAGPTPTFLSEKNKLKKGLWWEKTLLKGVDGVIYMKSSQNHHEKYSKDKESYEQVTFLYIPMLKLSEENFSNKTQQYVSSKYNKSLKLTYVGSLPLNIRNPLYGLKVLAACESASRLEINFVGQMPQSNSFLIDCSKIVRVNWVGYVKHEAALQYIKEADVLLNFGNKVEGMVPSKIFEYISYGKPILSFVPDMWEPTIPYLDCYSVACTIVETENFSNNVLKAQRFLTHLPVCNFTKDDLNEKFFLNTPESFADYIDLQLRNVKV